ncbi:MAG TPA: zf-TFIIB domain-containing protein [Sphingomicrobium sp.]|nr:zf-TFIIB domain-containing protein [Sphingomicrobium sp.]
MQCPSCGVQLTMSERQGIEIDYCPSCRGVWLDRGELDKIIERNALQPVAATAAPQPQWGGHDYGYGRHPHRKRRKSFLEELFD